MIYIQDISTHLGKTVTLKGWLYNKRSSGKIHFLQLRDGTGTIQCVVFKGEAPDEVFEKAGTITQESSITVTGVVKEDKRSALGFELGNISAVEILQLAHDYPITPKEHGPAFLLDNRHLWLRSSKQHAIMKIRNETVMAIRDYFYTRGFTLVDAPIFTPSSCEGTSNLFKTDYFGSPAFLSQSGQLYMEAAAMALGKVYCFGPTFRAEKSKTRRHLTEFWMMEPEVAFMTLEEDMLLIEDFLVTVIARVVDKCREHLKTMERDVSKLENIRKPFPRISYTEAIDLLAKHGMPVTWGDDLGADEETKISEQFDRPVMIHRYPAAIKSFYMKPDPENPKVALAVDVIGPEGYGEIVGGSERESNYDLLMAKIKEHGLDMSDFEWYLDLRKYGTVPHAGFGLGLERLITWICGIHHLRETIPFPRMMERMRP